MQISKDVTRRFKGAINSLWAVSASSTTDTRSAQGWSLLKSAAAVLCCVVLLFAPQAHAQTAGSGSIQGVVSDPAGAVIPDAVVTLTDQATQVSLTSKTSSSGSYAFPNIHVGTYTLAVSAQGFDAYTSTGNVLEVGSSIALNVKMTVGSTDTKIEVRSNGLALQTEDPSFKQTIDKNELVELPLNGRHMTDLIQLAGGSNGNSIPGNTGNNSKLPTQTTGISIAGAQGNSISYRLDGGDNNDYMGGANNPLPFPDAIGQFSVETAALGAQDGNHTGGLVNIVTQSGTNTYHGSIFEFARRTRFDASNFFSTGHNTLHQDQYGGTFGGHILRDKLFAFAAFQHQFFHQRVQDTVAYIPTAANLQGDFSATDPTPGSPKNNCSQAAVQLNDPISGKPLPNNKYNQPGGPMLPAWNASSLALLKQLPAIDPAIDVNNCGKVSFAIPKIDTDNEFDTRVDYTINKNNTLYARYFLDSEQIPSFYSPTNILLTVNAGNPEIRYQSVTIGENFVISSNIVNSIHLTGTRRQLSRGFNAATPNASAFGLKAYQTVASGLWIASGPNGNHGFTVGGGSNLLATINDNIPVDVADDVTWIHGKHQIAFGGSFLRNQLNINNGYQANGQFHFNGKWSNLAGGKTGDTNLDFLEGAMDLYTQSLPQQNALRGYLPTLYVQDTFHATPNLTVTAGVNWEPQFFPHDYFHRGATFNNAAFLANQHSSVYPNAPAGLFFYGDPGVKPAFTGNSPWQFNPNFAVTYDVSGTGKTVVRAGVAYEYDQPDFFAQQRVQQNPPFSVVVSPNTSSQLCFNDPWLIPSSTSTGQGCATTNGTDVNPFPFNPTNFTFPQQAQIIVLPPTYKAPNTLQWTASIQHQLPHGWNAQIFYTGNRTQHQLASTPLQPAAYVPGVWTAASANNYGCPGVVTTGPAATAAGTTNPAALVGSDCSVNAINLGNPNNKAVGAKNNTQARLALTAANPLQGNFYGGAQSGNPSLTETNNDYSNYNGVIVTLQHRFSSSFSLLTNYTWSKCLNVTDPQGDISGQTFSNPNNPAQDYGRCGQNEDVRNIFNASLVLKSAFPVHGLTGYLINNWQVAPLIRLTSGTANNISEGQDESFTVDGGDRPNLVPGVNPYNYAKIKSDHTGATYADTSYLNPAAFTLNTVPGTQGNVSRNKFSGPMYFQNDAEISRIFPLYERVNLDLRAEAFNFLNHPSFNNPNSNGPTFDGTNTFGEISGTSVNARIFQFAAKVSF